MRRAQVIVLASLVVGMLPALVASCEILDGIGSYNPAGDSSTERSHAGSDAADGVASEAASEATGPQCTGSCPCGMTPILPINEAYAFCISQTEVDQRDFQSFATIVDSGKWEASAPCEDADLLPDGKLSVNDFPVVNVNWCGAREYCRFIGAALCTGPVGDDEWDQWGIACGGRDHHPLPYGDVIEAGRCNVADAGGQVPQLVPFHKGTCQGVYAKVFDMVGNVSEWGACDEDGNCAARGGNLVSQADADCLTSVAVPMGRQSRFLGVRCCAPLRMDDGG